MARAVLIKLHLYFSAFFSAAIVLVAVSGGLYLMGIKGSVVQSEAGSLDSGEALLADPSHAAVAAALATVAGCCYRCPTSLCALRPNRC